MSLSRFEALRIRVPSVSYRSAAVTCLPSMPAEHTSFVATRKYTKVYELEETTTLFCEAGSISIVGSRYPGNGDRFAAYCVVLRCWRAAPSHWVTTEAAHYCNVKLKWLAPSCSASMQ